MWMHAGIGEEGGVRGAMHAGWWYQQMTAEALTSRQPSRVSARARYEDGWEGPPFSREVAEKKMGKMMMGCV